MVNYPIIDRIGLLSVLMSENTTINRQKLIAKIPQDWISLRIKGERRKEKGER
jgi:hypothetical protein